MKQVYVAQEVEEEEILVIIGVFETYEKAYERCVELYEERGFEVNKDKTSYENQLFKEDYLIEKYNIR